MTAPCRPYVPGDHLVVEEQEAVVEKIEYSKSAFGLVWWLRARTTSGADVYVRVDDNGCNHTRGSLVRPSDRVER